MVIYDYVVTMSTRTGKTLYLTMLTTNGKPQWTFNKGDSCRWQDKEVAERFCKSWFKKNFKDWRIEEIKTDLNKIL